MVFHRHIFCPQKVQSEEGSSKLLGSHCFGAVLMEMMDIQAAVRWLDESCVLMAALRRTLESHVKFESQPKNDSDPLWELITAQREHAEATFKVSLEAASAITGRMLLEQPLLLGQGENLTSLHRAVTRYDAESNKTSVLFETALANPKTTSSYPEDIEAQINELKAKWDSASKGPPSSKPG
jgi:hypothetical protein